MLQVSKSTIGEDVIFLRQEAKQNISNYINDRLPYEFEQCVVGISKILRHVLKITDDDTINTREKMKALSLAKDCYAVKLNLLGNAGVINSAMRNRYTVTEPDNEDQEKYLEVGKQTSEEIDSHLSERRSYAPQNPKVQARQGYQIPPHTCLKYPNPNPTLFFGHNNKCSKV
jgi:hypothetical protein